MRQELQQIIAEYEIKTFGNKKAMEIADEKIPLSERILYVGPSNITVTPRNTNAPKLRTGVIAITDQNIYVIHKVLWENGLDIFPTHDLELVSYKVTGLSGATFDLTLSNVSLSFLASSKKEHAEKLYNTLSEMAKHETPPDSASKQSGEADVIGAIEKLAELKEKGILSESEFETKKKDLLSRL